MRAVSRAPRGSARWGRVGVLRLLVVGLLACAPADDTRVTPRSTLFVGIDVSASFQDDGRYDDAVAFASHYIYGHLEGAGELEEPRALFVGSIGGETPGQAQAFHPIHDFEGKTPAEIEADLRAWFDPHDQFTDFNAFFRRAASLVQRQNLVLAPITLVLLTDGVPDIGERYAGPDAAERYAAIDLEPLEFLARNVTIRVLYPDPTVAVRWERDVPRDRVRMWTADHVVMRGWRDQLREPEPAPGPQLAAVTEREIEAASRGGAGESGGAETAAEDLMAEGSVAEGSVAEGSVAEVSVAEDSVAEASVVEVRGVPLARPAPVEEVEGAGGHEARAESESVLAQPDLWRWIQDNVDFRVGRRVF